MSFSSRQMASDNRAHDYEASRPPEMKKRKVRRGTRSCWECRRRKMKCIFASPAENSCTRCQRRGAKCIGQEFPEQISPSLNSRLQMGDRVVRVEALVDQLLEQGPNGANPAPPSAQAAQAKPNEEVGNLLTPPSVADNYFPQSFLGTSVENQSVEIRASTHSGQSQEPNVARFLSGHRDTEALSQALYEALPTRQDIQMIIKASGNTSTFFYQMLSTPYDRLDNTKSLEDVFVTPSPGTHPVLIARRMLHIATFLQHLHPDFYKEMEEFSENPMNMMNRLAGTAIGFISTNDDLTSCVEGLDALMVASWYQANGGKLRKGLITIRRAITLAQLMGFHRSGSCTAPEIVDANTKPYPEVIWFRMLSIERYICLMLGLPQSSLDKSMASESLLATDTPMSRLDRLHCAITSRILERNQSDPSPDDLSLTHELDEELQKAAADLPSRWWLTPNLANTSDNPDAMFWDMRRIFHQLFHYNLLIQLHLPYMLRSSADGQKYEYSKITCVNAAREVLSRFLMFQSFNRIAFCCRTVNFFCLMATMTLLLAHIDGHRRSPASVTHLQETGQRMSLAKNLLAHQRPSDRALVEQAQESMEEVSRLFGDQLSIQTADILRKLATVESEAASGQSCRVEGSRQKADGADGMTTSEIGGVFKISIPHFGVINITREGVISRKAHRVPHGQAQEQDSSGQSFGTDTFDSAAQEDDGQPFDDMSQNILNQTEPPFFSSDTNDWAFQGVDLAFFDTLMRGADDSTEWPAWMNDS